MGAEGGIYIIKDEKMREYYGWEKLVGYVGHGYYLQELDGKKYHTFYYGENVASYDPFDIDDNLSWAKTHGVTRKELEDFALWLNQNTTTIWEVWT